MIRNAFVRAALVVMSLAPIAQAATVTRGPYLQLGTDTSIVVRWRTDTATNSRVSYGSAPGSLGSVVDLAASTTEHEVAVTGLSAGTVYYYSVGSTTQTLAGNDANHFFLTAPAPGTPKPTRVWVLGDSGTADSSAQAVRNAYYSFTGGRHTDLWLMLGDNAYSSGTTASTRPPCSTCTRRCCESRCCGRRSATTTAAPPTPDIGGAEGASVALSATFGDPDASDVHTATVAWGDGSPVQAATVNQDGDSVAAAHVYADDGVYTVTVTVSDGRGGMGQGAASATIDNVPPTASAGGPYSGVEGSPITFTGTASDPGADTLMLEWDFDYDGNFQVGATGATAQRVYALDGAYTVALRVTDDHVSVLATTTVTVTDRPPVLLYLSLGSSATLPGGLSVANEDILAFDGSAFSLYFDGSDVGLSSFTIDAFTIMSPAEILLSFTSSGTVGGVSMDDSDVLKFTATSLGSNTAGTFSMYFDGSDVGLTSSDEDIDAIERLSDGRLLVSTTGSPSVTGVSSAADEDLLEFTPTSLGATTAGSWRLYFDGSDVGLTSSDEDVDAGAVDAAERIYLSTTGSFAVTGISGADEDVFVFVPTLLGSTTQGTFLGSLFFDGSAFGLSGNDVYAIDLP